MKLFLSLIFLLITASSFAAIDCRREPTKSDRKYCEEEILLGCTARSCRGAAICVGKNLAALQGQPNAEVSFVEFRSFGGAESFLNIMIRSGNRVSFKTVTATQTSFPKQLCHPHAVK